MKLLLSLAVLLPACAALQPKPPAHYDSLIAQQDREISALLQRQAVLKQHLETCDDPTQSPPAIYHELKQVLGPLGIEVTRQGRRVSVRLPHEKLFKKGLKPRLSADSAMLLDLASTALKLHPQHSIVVEAHSDDQSPNSSSFPSNWELSSARASAVARALIDTYGVEGGRITVSSRAHMDPISENSSADGRANNRRILLHIEVKE